MKQVKAKHLFKKQLEKGMVTHAYLVVGKNDTSAFARYMAKSLLCQSQAYGACDSCSICTRIDANNYPDYRILGRDDASIKKAEIMDLKASFAQTSLESSSRKIYVIEDVDTASISALNSILKFLEEPDGDIVAILTTAQPNRVLETIQSRCMIIQLENNSQDTLYQEGILKGLSEDDAFIGARIFYDLDTMIAMNESVVYRNAKDIAIDVLNYLNDRQVNQALIYMQQEGIKNKKFDKDSFAMFLDILITAIDASGHGIFKPLTNHHDFESLLNIKKILIQMKDRIRPGMNVNLLIDQLGYELVENERRRKL